MNILLGLLIPFVGTTLGAAMVFLMKNKLNKTYEIILINIKMAVFVEKAKNASLLNRQEYFHKMGMHPH